MTAIEWVHTDALNTAGAGPAVFVFDDTSLEGWTLKRVGFVYECLLELPVEIRHGDTVAEVLAFAVRHGASRVVARPFVDPALAECWHRLGAHLTTDLLPAEPFVRLTGPVDLRRFSRYWGRAAKALAGEV